MKRPRDSSPHQAGFSLIVTIAMLVVLTVVAVGLLSLSTITLKSRAITSAEERARANARMALMMAIDRLQAQMGPDQRISANASILSNSAVTNPQWMGVWDSWRAGGDGGNRFDRYPDATSDHQTIFMGLSADPDAESLHPTYETNREGHFREWLVSLNGGNAELITSGPSLVLDAAYMPDVNTEAVILVGEGTLGENATGIDLVKASLIPVDNTQAGGNTGRYGWWVGDESQKASIIGDPYHGRSDLTQAERLFQMQAPGSMGTDTVDELSKITNRGRSQLSRVGSRKTLDLVDGAQKLPMRPGYGATGPSGNFHDLTTNSRAVIADVREGGLKRDLSTLLERPIVPLAQESGVSDINDFMLYRFTAKDGVFASTAPQEVVPIQDLAAYYQLYSRGDSPSETGVRRQDITARGVQYSSSYLAGAPHILGVNQGTLGLSPIYPREYTLLYRHPKILKVQLLFSLFAEERENWRSEANLDYPTRVLNSHELLIGVTPSVTFWNPTNLPIFMQMDADALVANTFRMSDLPMRFRFLKLDRYGNTYESDYRSWLQLAGINDGLNLFWSGRHPVHLEPGEIKTYSLPYSGDLASLKDEMGHSGHWSGWNNSFFMKTDEYFEGHEVREGWEPESFILLPESAAGTNDEEDQTLFDEQGVDLRDVVNGRLRFKRGDRITIDMDCMSGRPVIELSARQSSYHRFDGNGISGTTSWDRNHLNIASYNAGKEGQEPAQSYNRDLFSIGMPGRQTEVSAPSRTGLSIISRSQFAAGWPFLQYSFMAACETNASSNGGIMGGRLTATRPFLHSSPLHGSPFLAGSDGEALYNFPYNWSANLINDVYEAPIQLNQNNQGFYGGGYTSESGTNHVIQQEIPLTPPLSIAALSHAHLGGYSVAVEDGMPFGDQPGEIRHTSAGARRTVLTRAVGYGGLLPLTLQAIGNSYAHPMLEPDATHKRIQRPLNAAVGLVDETFCDHSYLANKALWDDFFFSSISPQPSRIQIFESSTRDATEVASDFFFKDLPLPNSRIIPYHANIDEGKLTELFSEYDQYHNGMGDKIAAHLMVEGPFNINSTSVDAWIAFLSSLKGKPVAYSEPDDALAGRDLSVDIGVDGTPVGQVSLGGGRPYTGSQNDPSRPDQWRTARELTDNEIEELAEAMVEQVKLRGPFLSLSEFVNRRLDRSNPDLSAKGALQAALDDPSVSINAGFRRSGRRFSSTEITSMNPLFRDAAEGPVAYGSSAYVDQADILRNFGAQLTPRGDTFVVRAYGDSLDANGKVEARAWCEAIVQRFPEYVHPASISPTGDHPETKYENLISASNRSFGRKMEVVSFRWLNPTEI